MRDAVFLGDVGGGVLQEIVDVVAGGEHAGAAGNDQAADRRIVLRGVDRVAHAAIHVQRDRVLLFRPPQLDHPHRAFVGHNQMSGHEAVLQTSGKRLPLASL